HIERGANGHPAAPRPGSLAARWHARRQRWADRHPAFADLIAPLPQEPGHLHDPYGTRFYQRFRSWVVWCVRHRWLVIAATVAAFTLSLLMFRFVPQQFFPDSVRPELMVDMELAEGSSLRATRAHAERLEALLAQRSDLTNYTAYIGTGSPRFYLPLDQQLPAANFAQFVLMPESLQARKAQREWMMAEVVPLFPDEQLRVTRLEKGPPARY